MKLVIGHLYPRLMNMYADRGNVICLEQRCAWRRIHVEVRALGSGPLERATELDIVLIGGGQDREQCLAAADLVQAKGAALRDAIEDGLVALTVCGGYQLFGEFYRAADGTELRGLNILPVYTVHPGPQKPRCIGNIAVDWHGQTLVGFENHGGRTYLRDSAAAFARVLAGHGNNGEDGTEGARYLNVFGTYLHGSLLPKNPALADHLVLLALHRRYGISQLDPLDDSLEHAAHATALRLTKGG
jgi:CobQ-like glutamine amidotransferase family enzyme